MSEAAIFIGGFVVLFVTRLWIATAVMIWILPEADECPICNGHTVRVQSRGWNTLFPRLRTSWCIECGWEGLLRPSTRSTMDSGRSISKPRVSKPSGSAWRTD
jgi:hypothetical protein